MLPSSPLADLFERRVRVLVQERLAGGDEPGRAVAAHQAVVLVEGVGDALLAGVEALQGLDRLALAGDGQRGARVDRVAVDDRRCRRRSSRGRRPAWGRSRRAGCAGCRAGCSAARRCSLRSWPLTLSVISTSPERTFGPFLGGLGLVERGGGLAGQDGRGRRQARPPQEVAAAVPRRARRLSWDRVLASARFSLQLTVPPRCPLPREHAERKPMQAKSLAAASQTGHPGMAGPAGPDNC